MDAVIGRRPWRQWVAKRCTTSLGAFGVTAVVALGSCGPAALQCAPAPAAPASIAAPSSAVQQVVDLTNARRADNGLGPLTLSAALTNAAQAHSADQAATNTMSHAGSDGSNLADRLARAGYRATTWAENVAAGYPDATAVMSGWMNSPGHRANILNGNFTQIGVGVAYSANG
ncbi:MAG: CAP domain-containing protein, partial [Ilumatobacteraceae bacterium]